MQNPRRFKLSTGNTSSEKNNSHVYTFIITNVFVAGAAYSSCEKLVIMADGSETETALPKIEPQVVVLDRFNICQLSTV